MPENIEIRNIRTDGGTQPRAGLDDKTVADYADEIKQGAKFPPVVLFYDGSHYWLADGFHRVAAAKFAGKQRILAEIRQGTLRDAQLYAVGANATHGLRRSREDKRRAVEMLLTDAEWGQWADREIARRCKVSNTYVGNIRKELGLTVNVDSENGNGDGRKYITKHGTEAVMTTGKRLRDTVIDALIWEFKTNDMSVLSSYARALANGKGDTTFLWRAIFNAKLQIPQEALTDCLTELVHYWQAEINKNALPADVPDMPALLRLVDVIRRSNPDGITQALEGCQRMSGMGIMTDSKPIWTTLEAMICDLRPN